MVELVAKEIVRNLILVFLLVLVMFLAWDQSRAATVDLTLPPGDYYLVPVQPYTVVTIQSTPVDPPVLDTDGDGVTDDLDQCPDTPLGDEVDATGCTVVPPPVDSDGDGFADDIDVCPSEPGVAPDGCPVVPPDPPQPPTDTTVYLQKTLSECLTELSTVAGGWCEMPIDVTPILPTRDDMPMEQYAGGPSAIWTHWNGAAVDKDGLRMWFHGGGHAAYGGVEVIELDLVSGKVERLSDSPPFDVYVEREKNGVMQYALRHDPNVAPESTHTYDGFNYDPDTGLLILFTGYGYTNGFQEMDPPPPVVEKGIGIYAFNQTDHAVKGVQPGAWRWLSTWDEDAGYPMSAHRSDGILISAKVSGSPSILRSHWDGDAFVVDAPADFRLKPQAKGPEPIMDVFSDGSLWTLSRQHISRWENDVETVIWQDYENWYPDTGRSLAEYGDGVLMWDGVGVITQVSRDGTFRRCDFGTVVDHDKKTTFSKWFKHPAYDDIFIGWSDAMASGPMVYKHDPTCGEVLPPAMSFQGILDSGNDVAVAPDSTLWSTAIIEGPKSVDMNNARILFPLGKGTYQTKGGPITLRDVSLPERGVVGIWAEQNRGEPIDLTIDGFDIAWQGMGVQAGTTSYTGQLTLRNGTIRDGLATANERKGMDHLIYAGKLASVTVDNVTLACHREWGHLFKSRAAANYIHNSLLDQEDCDSSRLIDISCGGYVEIVNSAMIQSPIGNPDMLAIGTENCKDTAPPSKLVMENTYWEAHHPKAYFMSAKVPVEIECRGDNVFVGIPNPCGEI